MKREKTFKFGDSRVFGSLGAIVIPLCVHVLDEKNQPRITRCDTIADIIDSRIPMLVSRSALKKMNGVLGFESSQLMINRRYRAQLHVLPNGHMGLPLADRSDKPSGNPDVAMWVDERAKGKVRIYTLDREAEKTGESVSEITLKKMHLHMAHSSVGNMRRILKASGRPFLESDLLKVVQECACVRQDSTVQRPLISRYAPDHCGHTVCSDVF